MSDLILNDLSGLGYHDFPEDIYTLAESRERLSADEYLHDGVLYVGYAVFQTQEEAWVIAQQKLKSTFVIKMAWDDLVDLAKEQQLPPLDENTFKALLLHSKGKIEPYTVL